MLAEANLGLRKLKIAEEFLSLANWVLLKHKGETEGGSNLAIFPARSWERWDVALATSNRELCVSCSKIECPSIYSQSCFLSRIGR